MTEYFEEFELRLHGILSINRDRIIEIIRDIFQKIPEQDKDVLMYKRNIHFILPETCTADLIFANPLISSDERYGPMIPVWLICLRNDLITNDKDEIIYTIAHELAHAYLEHSGTSSSLEQAKTLEIEADQKVLDWGFETELKNTPDNFIYGNGIKNIR